MTVTRPLSQPAPDAMRIQALDPLRLSSGKAAATRFPAAKLCGYMQSPPLRRWCHVCPHFLQVPPIPSHSCARTGGFPHPAALKVTGCPGIASRVIQIHYKTWKCIVYRGNEQGCKLPAMPLHRQRETAASGPTVKNGIFRHYIEFRHRGRQRENGMRPGFFFGKLPESCFPGRPPALLH